MIYIIFTIDYLKKYKGLLDAKDAIYIIVQYIYYYI
jgi:hypothetical protein